MNRLKIDAIDHDGFKVTFDWIFAVTDSKYPTLGADFFRYSDNFKSLTSGYLILMVSGKQHHVPVYLSTAFNGPRKMKTFTSNPNETYRNYNQY